MGFRDDDDDLHNEPKVEPRNETLFDLEDRALRMDVPFTELTKIKQPNTHPTSRTTNINNTIRLTVPKLKDRPQNRYTAVAMYNFFDFVILINYFGKSTIVTISKIREMSATRPRTGAAQAQ